MPLYVPNCIMVNLNIHKLVSAAIVNYTYFKVFIFIRNFKLVWDRDHDNFRN